MQKSGIMGMFGGLFASAIAATLASSPAPTLQRQRRVAPNVIRSFWYNGRRDHKAGKKAGQTEAQVARALAAAEEKRARRAIAYGANAKRSAEGYHPVHRRLGLTRYV